MLMNSQFAAQFSKLIAERVRSKVGDQPEKQASHVWLLAFGRRPSEKQSASSVNYLKTQIKHYQQNPIPNDKTLPQSHALASYCQALISSNGFLYID